MHHPNQIATVALANLAVRCLLLLPHSKYYGATPSEVVTPLAAIRLALPGASVTWGGDAQALVWTAANEAADVARCQAAVRGNEALGEGPAGGFGPAACGCGRLAEPQPDI